jgi:hypothetical protein
LECGNARILDFIQVLDGLGLINQQIGTSGIWTETPDLSGIGDIPAVFVGKMSCASLGIITGTNFASLNLNTEFLRHGLCFHEQTIVLVGGLGESDHA